MKNSGHLLLTYLKIFLTMLKIGLFTFGGGYAMIAILEDEFVDKKKWIDREEFTDLIAVSESTPGPIAINSATYLGYKTGGFFGSLLATLGVCVAPVAIIYIISLFFEEFLALKFVKYAFKGINVCVTFLILSAGIKMFVKGKKTVFSCVIFIICTLFMILSSLFSFGVSSIYCILAGGVVGILYYAATLILNKSGKKNGAGGFKDGTKNIKGER